MSKSLKRVRAALDAVGVGADLVEMDGSTRTADEAAAQAGCARDQIVKSILFHAPQSDRLCLFLTAGGNRVGAERAAALAGEPLDRAAADLVRARTGFAIGGVAPIGHVVAPRAWLDPRLMEFDRVWAAAGTPRHIFAIAPDVLLRITGAETGDFTE